MWIKFLAQDMLGVVMSGLEPETSELQAKRSNRPLDYFAPETACLCFPGIAFESKYVYVYVISGRN